MQNSIKMNDCVLPVSTQLISVLSAELMKAYPNLTDPQDAEAITFTFRDPKYSSEAGGYHPVEVRFSRCGDGFNFDYLTDFSYVGAGYDVELAKEIDFDLVSGCCEVRYCRPIPAEDSADLFELVQDNFISYYNMGVFNVEVRTEL